MLAIEQKRLKSNQLFSTCFVQKRERLEPNVDMLHVYLQQFSYGSFIS